MTIKRLGSYALMLSALVVAPAASAATLSLDGVVDTNANVNTNVNTNVINATVRANATGSAATTATTSGAEGSGQMTSSSTATVQAETFVLKRSDLAGGNAATIEPSSVTSSTQFEAYARSIMTSDENLTKVETSADEVSVWYKENGEFLGFIPVTVSTRTTVEADGTVEVDRPWYNFLTRTSDSASLKADLESTAGTIARAEAAAELSSSAQARIVNAVRSVMKANFEATASTEASADVNN